MHHTTRVVLALALLSGTAVADSSVTKKTTTSQATPPPTLELSAGAYRSSRSLFVTAENPNGVTQYAGIPSDGVTFELAAYPLHHRHANGWLSSAGVSFGIGHSIGTNVTFIDDQPTTVDAAQSAWNAGAHYRLSAGRVSLDTELGLAQQRYSFGEAPLAFEVPNTSYTYAAAGAHVDLDVFRGITLGGGAKYLAGIGGAGELTEMDWYGSGTTKGLAVDATLTIPLPKGLFVRARLAATTLTTTVEGVGAITEMEGVVETDDTTATAGITFGIRR